MTPSHDIFRKAPKFQRFSPTRKPENNLQNGLPILLQIPNVSEDNTSSQSSFTKEVRADWARVDIQGEKLASPSPSIQESQPTPSASQVKKEESVSPPSSPVSLSEQIKKIQEESEILNATKLPLPEVDRVVEVSSTPHETTSQSLLASQTNTPVTSPTHLQQETSTKRLHEKVVPTYEETVPRSSHHPSDYKLANKPQKESSTYDQNVLRDPMFDTTVRNTTTEPITADVTENYRYPASSIVSSRLAVGVVSLFLLLFVSYFVVQNWPGSPLSNPNNPANPVVAQKPTPETNTLSPDNPESVVPNVLTPENKSQQVASPTHTATQQEGFSSMNIEPTTLEEAGENSDLSMTDPTTMAEISTPEKAAAALYHVSTDEQRDDHFLPWRREDVSATDSLIHDPGQVNTVTTSNLDLNSLLSQKTETINGFVYPITDPRTFRYDLDFNVESLQRDNQTNEQQTQQRISSPQSGRFR
ncbi:MAG: hypothetical protein MPJ24_04895 [Pirellulaceae bacterium]|nr:hypothetical protein [Pirellulaceae bacterium]